MRFNGNTVPTGRDVTYSSDEVTRKDSEVLFDTAFNDDQKTALLNVFDCCSDKPLRVTFTFDEDSDTPLADKTFSEIYEAMTNGRLVYGILSDQGVHLDYYTLSFIDEELMAAFIRTNVETQENDEIEAISTYFEITPENEVTYREVVLANS